MAEAKKMPKIYAVIWGIVTVAYGVWMSVFMRWDQYGYLDPEPYKDLPADEFIALFDGVLQKPLYPSALIFWLWVVGSTALLALYPVFIKKILYAEKLGKGVTAFCLVNLIVGFVFITWYGFLSYPPQFGNILTDVTASMLGLRYPWLFKGWGVFASLSIFTNTLYMYRKNQFYSKVGVIVASLGCASIFVTINAPSAGLELVATPRCIGHWATALIFAFLGAAGIIVFLYNMVKTKDKKYCIATAIFATVLVLMLILLVTVGNSAFIVYLPMWVAYGLLFIINFTSFFDKKSETKSVKEAAKV